MQPVWHRCRDFSLNYHLPAEQLKFAGLKNVILCIIDCSSHCQKNNLAASQSEGEFEVWQYQGFSETEGIGYSKAFLGFQKQQIEVQHSIDNVLYLVTKLRPIGISVYSSFAPKKV